MDKLEDSFKKEAHHAKTKNQKTSIFSNKFKSDNEIDQEIAFKIEEMTKTRDRRKHLNNPPLKETFLKGSKDKDGDAVIVSKYSKNGFGGITKKVADEI